LSESDKDGFAKRLVKAIENKALEAIEKSADIPAFATAILGIPTYGPPIYQVITVMQTKAWQRRMEQLALSLHEEATTIDASKVDTTFFETEAFVDVVRKVIEYTSKTRDDAKIRLYARILTRLPLLDNVRFRNSAETFLAILLELEPVDLKVAAEIYQSQKELPLRIRHAENEISMIKSAGWEHVQVRSGASEADYDLALRKLDRVGLISPIRQQDKGYREDIFMITQTFRTLMELVGKLD
jgi:hypothetical protein